MRVYERDTVTERTEIWVSLRHLTDYSGYLCNLGRANEKKLGVVRSNEKSAASGLNHGQDSNTSLSLSFLLSLFLYFSLSYASQKKIKEKKRKKTLFFFPFFVFFCFGVGTFSEQLVLLNLRNLCRTVSPSKSSSHLF